MEEAAEGENMMFKGAAAGGGAMNDMEENTMTSSSTSQGKPPQKVSRMRQDFPEVWIWTETMIKYFKQ